MDECKPLRYGPSVIFGIGWSDLKWTPERWAAHLDSYKGDTRQGSY